MQIKLLKIEVEVENVVLMNHSLNFLMHLILKKKGHCFVKIIAMKQRWSNYANPTYSQF